MSSFSQSQVRRFAAQAATQRAHLFGDSVDVSNSNEKNFQVGEVDGSDVTWGATFRAAFTRLSSVAEMQMHGRTINCTAKISVRNSLGIAYTPATLFKHLPTGDVYEVAQIGVVNASSAEVPILLRRRED